MKSRSVCTFDCVDVCGCMCVRGVGRALLQDSWLPIEGRAFLLCVVRVFACLYCDVITLLPLYEKLREVIQAYRYIHIYFLEPERKC